VITILVLDRHVPTPGDIFNALTSHPGAYTLSLGHMEDLTLQSFAYLRLPLLLAAVAFVIGAIGTFRASPKRAYFAAALMMVVFFQAAQQALVVFDPYLSSRPLAEAILHQPDGKLIIDRFYYTYSSVAFYTDRPLLMLNGNVLNLSYGASAPNAPRVFIDDAQLKELWAKPDRYYLVTSHTQLSRLENALGREKLNVVAFSGGKYVFTNLPVPGATLPQQVSEIGGTKMSPVGAAVNAPLLSQLGPKTQHGTQFDTHTRSWGKRKSSSKPGMIEGTGFERNG
jgi:hypothetical protein